MFITYFFELCKHLTVLKEHLKITKVFCFTLFVLDDTKI